MPQGHRSVRSDVLEISFGFCSSFLDYCGQVIAGYCCQFAMSRSKRDPAQSKTRCLLPEPQCLVLVGALDDVVTDRLDLLQVQDVGEADHALISQGSVMHHARPGLAVRDQRAAAQVRQHRAAVGGVAVAAAAEASVLSRALCDLLGRAGCGGWVER